MKRKTSTVPTNSGTIADTTIVIDKEQQTNNTELLSALDVKAEVPSSPPMKKRIITSELVELQLLRDIQQCINEVLEKHKVSSFEV